VEMSKTNEVSVEQKNDTDAIIVTSKEKVEVKTADSSKVETVKQTEKRSLPVYKVQLFASNTKLKANASDFKGVKDTDFFVEGGLYKYTLGAETDYNKIASIRKQVVSKFPGAFIIAFVGDKKMTAQEALKLNK
jgi:N-acetylmuramoyl-L-alanine amidase